MRTIPLNLDGYTDLPPGLVANIVTFLEMRAPPEERMAAPDERFRLRHIAAPTVAWYRDLDRRVGERWLWTSRAIMDDATLAARLTDPATTIIAIEGDGAAIGFGELDRSVEGEVEIVSFGVVAEAIGTGAARVLMDGVLAEAWARGVTRVWLHTCSFDHPAALPFYRRAGFVPYKFAIEVFRDPRLTGHLPRHAGPHVPLIEPGSAPRR